MTGSSRKGREQRKLSAQKSDFGQITKRWRNGSSQLVVVKPAKEGNEREEKDMKDTNVMNTRLRG